MATPPKTTAGSSPSDATKPAEDKAASKAAGADPQKVDFDMDADVKKQLDAGGSYKPGEEKTKEYIPPGPHPMGEGVGGASGGVKLPEAEPAPAAAPAPVPEKK